MQRVEILRAIGELEALNPTANPVDTPLVSGRWALLYTGAANMEVPPPPPS